MAEITVTSSGITNPSTTTRFYKGASGVRPPASAGALPYERAEHTTGEYSNASADDTSYALKNTNYNYAGHELEFKIPAVVLAGILTRIDFSVLAYGSDGYSVYGWRLYIKNLATGAWQYLTETTSSGYVTLSSAAESNLDDYIDANGRICLLAISRSPMDGNGSGADLNIDYAFIKFTYTPGAAEESFRTRISFF